jgi:glutaredoxin
MRSVILYSTGCPKCKILQEKLDEHNIHYTYCNDMPAMRLLKIMSVPVLSVNGELMLFAEAIEWVNKEGTLEN